jgi:methyl-accepting chemotaxis protein
VANEIKELAKQTSTATLEIKEKIANIQGSTDGAVKGINDITDVINRVNDIVYRGRQHEHHGEKDQRQQA